MKIKRGRPKKEKEETLAQPVHNPLGTNRIYRFKNGHSCTVMYSGNKSKPEEILFK
jgi:hypothetical protein